MIRLTRTALAVNSLVFILNNGYVSPCLAQTISPEQKGRRDDSQSDQSSRLHPVTVG
jgi:hypothetical protein